MSGNWLVHRKLKFRFREEVLSQVTALDKETSKALRNKGSFGALKEAVLRICSKSGKGADSLDLSTYTLLVTI